MKKLFLSVAILATVVSCSKNEVADNVTPKNQIGFSTLNDKVTTRAANDNGDGYVVYAEYTTALSTTNFWYINALAVATDNTTANPYWPIPALDFYAYATANTSPNITVTATVPTSVPAKGSISINYTVPVNADDDFTVAKPVLNQTYASANIGTGDGAGEIGTAGTVALTFSHMLAKISINATMDNTLTNYTLAVNGATTLAVKSNTGTVVITPTAELPLTTTVPVLTSTAAASTVTYTQAVAHETATTASTAANFLIMPYSNENYIVTINGVTLTDEHGVKFMDNATLTHTFTGTDATKSFDGGKHYKLNFTVAPKKILFTSSIVEWTNADVPVKDPVETTPEPATK